MSRSRSAMRASSSADAVLERLEGLLALAAARRRLACARRSAGRWAAGLVGCCGFGLWAWRRLRGRLARVGTRGLTLRRLALRHRLRRPALCSRGTRRRCPGRAMASPFADLDDLRGEPLDEVAIVRDEDQRAAVVVERVEQHVLRVDVEVVGRLVEQQRVRRAQQHARHGQARALAARQHARLLVDVVAREQEAAEDVADGRHHRGRRARRRASRRPSATGSSRVASSCAKYCITTWWPSWRSPASGASSPESMRISVDLPAPLGPTSAMRSPRSMCRLTSASTTLSP